MDGSASESQHYAPSTFLTHLLRDVSRSFYWTVRVLPGAIRPQIGLAYLLARATDTIADTGLVPVSERLQALGALRDRILGKNSKPLDFQSLMRVADGNKTRASVAERVLVERIEEVLAQVNQFAPPDQQLVREVLATIISGQALDLERFSQTREGHITALQTDAELDDYTYRVAGCVGEFWTHICRAHLFPRAGLDDTRLLANGIRFGKGLQMINILRDIPADLRQGRCYIPAGSLAAEGLNPADLLQPSNEPRFRALYRIYLSLAQEHLDAGWNYTNMLPRHCRRVRLACAWPILIGARTLAKLKSGNVLDPSQRIKISRAEVKRVMASSIWALAWRPAWEKLYKNASSAP